MDKFINLNDKIVEHSQDDQEMISYVRNTVTFFTEVLIKDEEQIKTLKTILGCYAGGQQNLKTIIAAHFSHMLT